MIIKTLFPTHPMSSDMAMVHIARRLSEKVTDLEDMLDDECRRSKYLAYLLQTMGARAELRTSTYDGSKYISLGYVSDKNPMFGELVSYFELREEEEKCEDTN